MESYPYTNLQNLNLDWIIQVVMEFKEKYPDFEQAVTDALQAIEDAKNASIDTLQNALSAATVTLENAKLAAINDLQTEKAGILGEMETALNAALTRIINVQTTSVQAVEAQYNQAVTRLNALMATFPLDDAQIIGQLQIINSILNGTDALTVQWQQGTYNGVTPFDWFNTPNTVSSVRQAGCAGRKLHVQANTAGHLITYIYYWRGNLETLISIPINATETTFIFPSDATYFSVLLGTNPNMTTPINLADVTATAEWNIAGFIQRPEFEEFKEVTNDELTLLKSAVTSELKVFEDGTNQLLNGGMVTGSINADGTIDKSIKYRAYTPALQKYNRDILLHINAPATGFFLCMYDENNNILSRTSYGVDTNVPANTYFRVCAFAASNTEADVLYKAITFSSLLKSLSDDFENMKDWEDLKQYALFNGAILFNGEYINASVTATGVVDTSIAFRVSTKDILHNVNDIYIKIKSGWQVWFTTYQQDGTFIARENKQAGIFIVPENTYFRVTIAKATEAPGKADIKEFVLNAFVILTGNTITRKWVAIGDSLTEVNETALKRYCDYVAENLNLELVNMGVGGTGYKNGSDSSRAFYQRVQNVPSDADVYTFFGSGNDGASTLNNFPIGDPTDTGTNSICGCVNTALDNIYARNPSAIVGIITPTPWAIWPPYGVENAGATLPAQDPSWMQKYSDALVAVCKRRGIPCLDLYNCSAMRPWDETFRTLFYSKDGNNGVHPDENGQKLFIAPHVQEFIKTLIQYP